MPIEEQKVSNVCVIRATKKHSKTHTRGNQPYDTGLQYALDVTALANIRRMPIQCSAYRYEITRDEK